MVALVTTETSVIVRIPNAFILEELNNEINKPIVEALSKVTL